jgi:allantoin racemase
MALVVPARMPFAGHTIPDTRGRLFRAASEDRRDDVGAPEPDQPATRPGRSGKSSLTLPIPAAGLSVQAGRRGPEVGFRVRRAAVGIGRRVMKRILVLNPNSSPEVTQSMDAALAMTRLPGGPEVSCATLAEGPPGIETQYDVESVVLPTLAYFKAHPADAYVIGCFSDPGLHVAREALAAPVLGIAESAIHLAMGIGRRFGIVAIKAGSIPRHMRNIRQLGVQDRLAGDRPLDIGVTAMLSGPGVVDRIVEVGTELRDRDGADVVILGCASMGGYRAEIERRLGVPVVDPTQAAVVRAIGLLTLGYGLVS